MPISRLFVSDILKIPHDCCGRGHCCLDRHHRSRPHEAREYPRSRYWCCSCLGSLLPPGAIQIPILIMSIFTHKRVGVFCSSTIQIKLQV